MVWCSIAKRVRARGQMNHHASKCYTSMTSQLVLLRIGSLLNRDFVIPLPEKTQIHKHARTTRAFTLRLPTPSQTSQFEAAVDTKEQLPFVAKITAGRKTTLCGKTATANHSKIAVNRNALKNDTFTVPLFFSRAKGACFVFSPQYYFLLLLAPSKSFCWGS